MAAPAARTYDPKSVPQAGEGAVRVETPFAHDAFAVPDVTEEQYTAAQTSANGATPSTGADKLIAYAKQYIGTPYKWGGSSPLGFDCSGLVQYVFKNAAGVNLPRVSYQQAAFGKRVAINQLRPGDLVAWDNSSANAGADHIAIYIGNGQIIAAPKPGDHVKIQGLFDVAHAWGVAMNL